MKKSVKWQKSMRGQRALHEETNTLLDLSEEKCDNKNRIIKIQT